MGKRWWHQGIWLCDQCRLTWRPYPSDPYVVYGPGNSVRAERNCPLCGHVARRTPESDTFTACAKCQASGIVKDVNGLWGDCDRCDGVGTLSTVVVVPFYFGNPDREQIGGWYE